MLETFEFTNANFANQESVDALMALMVSAENLNYLNIMYQWGDRPINVYFSPATSSNKSSI